MRQTWFSRLLEASRITKVAACFAALAMTTQIAPAQDYPERPLRIVVGFGQGGPTDVVARVLAEQLTHELKQRVYVENRPGASGNIATQALANAEADGYTYMIGATPFAINHTLFPDFPVKFGADVVAVRSIGATTNALVINPSHGVATLQDFTAFVKARGPEQVTYITLGRGSSSHLAGVEFDRLAGTKMAPVPYRGSGEALQDILAGHALAWFAPIPSVSELVKARRLVALGVTGPARAPELPDVPTLDEAGLRGFDVRLWVGLFARAGVREPRRQAFDRALVAAMATDAYKSALAAQGVERMEMTPEAFAAFVEQEIRRWKAVVATLP